MVRTISHLRGSVGRIVEMGDEPFPHAWVEYKSDDEWVVTIQLRLEELEVIEEAT